MATKLAKNRNRLNACQTDLRRCPFPRQCLNLSSFQESFYKNYISSAGNVLHTRQLNVSVTMGISQGESEQ